MWGANRPIATDRCGHPIASRTRAARDAGRLRRVGGMRGKRKRLERDRPAADVRVLVQAGRRSTIQPPCHSGSTGRLRHLSLRKLLLKPRCRAVARSSCSVLSSFKLVTVASEAASDKAPVQLGLSATDRSRRLSRTSSLFEVFLGNLPPLKTVLRNCWRLVHSWTGSLSDGTSLLQKPKFVSNCDRLTELVIQLQ